MLWDLNEAKHLYTLDSGDTINALCFSPNRYWLCAATGPSIKIWVRDFKQVLLIRAMMKHWMSAVFFDDIRGCFWALSLVSVTVKNLKYCTCEQLQIVLLLCRIWRARSLWMSWDRKWSAQAARLNPHSAIAWHGLLMDRYMWPPYCLMVLMVNPSDYTHSLLTLMSTGDSPANMRGPRYLFWWPNLEVDRLQATCADMFFFSSQTLFAGYTDNLIRVWQVTIGTR